MSTHSGTPRPDRPASRLPVLVAAAVLLLGFGEAQAIELEVLVKDTTGNSLEDAVVLARRVDSPAVDVVAGDPEPSSVTISQRNKQFEPYVSVIRVGMSAEFPNHDNILHNVYSISTAKRFQLPLYKDEPPNPIVFDKPGVVILGCNIHDWMVAYVYVSETPYFAKTGANGTAILVGLQPGSYLVRVWHPRKKRRGSSPEQQILITDKISEPLEFAVALKPEWRPRQPRK